ncbi:MAG: lysophospholipid acyltransferase family protein [Ignavibacteriae bacterium]|nr:lysophospholipid acyltransferase family protein [Ignavibacteriota bacterium]
MLNKYKLEFLAFNFLGNLLSIFGFKNLKYSAKFLAVIFFSLIRIRRNVVIKNLSIAFPHLDKKRLKKLAFKNYVSIAQTFLEVFCLKKLNKNEIASLFTEEDKNLVKGKVKNQNGIIILTAHVGNWELGAVAAGIVLERRINVLIKEQKNIFVRDWLEKIRQRFGNRQITLGANIREIYSSIKNGEIIGIVGDQRGPREGIKVNFFGRNTSVFAGTASIAVKTGCPVIIIFVVRKADGTFGIVAEELIYDKNLVSKEDQINSFNQIYMSKLEAVIRNYPEQWLWMHNIWKY